MSARAASASAETCIGNRPRDGRPRSLRTDRPSMRSGASTRRLSGSRRIRPADGARSGSLSSPLASCSGVRPTVRPGVERARPPGERSEDVALVGIPGSTDPTPGAALTAAGRAFTDAPVSTRRCGAVPPPGLASIPRAVRASRKLSIPRGESRRGRAGPDGLSGSTSPMRSWETVGSGLERRASAPGAVVGPAVVACRSPACDSGTGLSEVVASGAGGTVSGSRRPVRSSSRRRESTFRSGAGVRRATDGFAGAGAGAGARRCDGSTLTVQAGFGSRSSVGHNDHTPRGGRRLSEARLWVPTVGRAEPADATICAKPSVDRPTRPIDPGRPSRTAVEICGRERWASPTPKSFADCISDHAPESRGGRSRVLPSGCRWPRR